MTRAKPTTPTPAKPRKPRHKPRRIDLHRGVCLLPPDAHGHGWRVRYRDPATAKTVRRSLTDHDAATPESRLTFCRDLAAYLARAKRNALTDTVDPLDVSLAAAVALWVGSKPRAEPTRLIYTLAASNFVGHVAAWAAEMGRPVTYCRQIDKYALAAYHARAQAARIKPRGKRPANDAQADTREAVSINHEYRMVKTFLYWMRRAAGLERLTRDDIKEQLPLLAAPEKPVAYLSRPALRRLATLAPKHEPQAWPRIRSLLFTGMREREHRMMDWSWITDGATGPVIRVPAIRTKTRRERDVELATVSAYGLPPRPAGVTSGPVWTGLSRAQLHGALKRLRETDRNMAKEARATIRACVACQAGAPARCAAHVDLHAAPLLADLRPHTLRRTSVTYFTCTPKLGLFRSAHHHGHDVKVAFRRYARLVLVASECTTLEEAMGIADLLAAPAPRPMRNTRAVRRDAKAVAA